ncbi:hypothetical protein BDR06DRAFT_872118, partial [Suillus hirtellus]
SLAHNHLCIMASLVSSEHAVLAARITIIKYHNCLKANVVEVLQVFHFMYQ